MQSHALRSGLGRRLGYPLFISLCLILTTLAGPVVTRPGPVAAQTTPAVTFVAPDDGAILYGPVTLRANVSGATATSVEFFYDPHEDDEPEVSLGLAAFNATSGYWELAWDTRTVLNTFNDIDTNRPLDGIEDTTVNLTKPPTSDGLRVAAVTGAGNLGAAIDVRIQNMLTARIFLPDNTDDVRGFQDLEALITSESEIETVRFDVYPISAIDPRILTPFGEFESLGEPVLNAQYGRNADGISLGNPVWPTGAPAYAIGAASLEGSRRWVFRGWDTTTIPDGTWSIVATATDAAGRRATYMIVVFIVNDLRVAITAPDDGDTVSRFVALEARTSSLTGADNAAPGSLWPATAVNFTIGTTTIPATETPAGSGRWRAVWDGDAFAPGPYTILATATNNNPNGAETATDSVNVNLVAPGATLDAFFPFDWSNCTLQVCSFLDGSSGGPTSWLWNFGDGNTSTSQLPTHTYANYGVYDVSLTVSNDGGITTDTYTRRIPVGNTGVVSFNRNQLDDGATQFIDWTSAFKNFNYVVSSTLAIPVMWETTVGSATFNSLPTAVCDDDETTSNQTCVIFTPEEATGDAPTVVGAAQDGVLFTMRFTQVQYRGVTDIFKGKANIRVVVNTDLDGNGSVDQTNQLGTNVDVTNSGAQGDENTVVRISAPAEGQFVGGSSVPVNASVVSSVTPNQVEFFVNGTTSLGVDTNGADGWSRPWNTLLFTDGPYQLTAVASFGTLTAMSEVRNVTVNNAVPPEPTPPATTFQIGRVSDTTGQFISFATEIAEAEPPGGSGGGRPERIPTLNASMTAEIIPGSITIYPGGTISGGLIGGDAIEFDVRMTNTSADPGTVLTAYAFQSKFSESPALASRIGDKAFYGVLVPDAYPAGPMTSVKKNGTSNGLFSGRWKGICINSSVDFLPEFNSGLQDESLECAGNRADTNFDGLPELQIPVQGIYPGQSQTVRVRIEAGTTDGALHVVMTDTLRGRVAGVPFIGPNGLTYFVPTISNTGVISPNVVAIPDWGDNKVLRNADGTFNPTFAPAADDFTFRNQQYLTLPRRNFAFTDILGRNHTCETYGLHLIPGIPCSGNPTASPVFGFLGIGDLVPGAQNFAALLQGFGEYVETGNPDDPYAAPNYPYGVPCVNPATPDGLRCGARPFTPIAEFYRVNPDGTLTQQMVAGSYGPLGSATQYVATLATAATEDWKEEVYPEQDAGAPPVGPQLSTSASGQFHSLRVVQGAGINGGDAVEFTIDIINTSRNPDAYLTAFNYQTKQRNLADIGGLDGFTQDRRDIRLDSTLPQCLSLNDGACFNTALGIGHFPNTIGNGLLFGQMVWQSGRVDRAGETIVPDFVAVDPVNGIDPVPFQLESVKKNGPFSPILKGNTNFICVKSGLFFPDQDADAACAGDPAILVDPEGELVPGNISRRLGLAPGQSQSVRIRQEFGDFRGAILQVLSGTLTAANVDTRYTGTQGLARFFDCEDQRELEFCHPDLVGDPIVYLPNSTATWLTPATLEEIEWVIINQPGDAPRIMNFQQNFGYILAMAGFIPSAEFYAPDPNPLLVGTPDQGILIRQQVLGAYAMTTVTPAAPTINSLAVTSGATGSAYSLDTAPSGMTIDASTGLISWTPTTGGAFNVTARATNSVGSNTQSFQIVVAATSAAPSITSAANTAGVAGSAYSYQVTASGSPAPTFTLDVAPTGMTIDANTGLISWTPTTGGSYGVTVRATNSAGSNTQSFQIVVLSPPVITSAANTAGTAGSAYSYQVVATGTPGPTFSLVAAPAGMTINNTTGLVSWTPAAAGSYAVTVRASNSAGNADQSFQVAVVWPVLDNFNRANGGLGSNWLTTLGDYKIANQQLDVGLGGPIVWKTSFGAAQEAAITLTTIDSSSLSQHGLILKGDSKQLKTSGIAVIYEPGKKRIVVQALAPLRLPKTVGTFSVTLKNGDRLGARALADGKVQVFVNGVQLGTAVNAGTFFANKGGHVGLWYLFAGKAFADDFWGGTMQ